MNIFKTIQPLLICFCFAISAKSQNSYDSSKASGLIKKMANQISKDSFLIISTTDQQVEEPQYKKLISEFISRSKEYELYELSHHPNSMVRCYAFEGLYYKKYPLIVDVMEEHLKDSLLVPTKMGCGTGEDAVMFIMMGLLKSNRIDLNDWLSIYDKQRFNDIIKIHYPNDR